MKLLRLGSLAALTLGFFSTGCGPSDAAGGDGVEQSRAALSPAVSTFPSTYARQWMLDLAFSVKYDNIAPPVASRSFAYAAIAAYEATVHGMPGNQSLVGQLNGLTSLPQPDPSATYDWPTVLAATLGKVVPATYVYPNVLFFEYTTRTHISLESIEGIQVSLRVDAGIAQSVVDASVTYGHALGDAIAAWANQDGYAEARYQGYVPPSGDPSNWVATGYVDALASRPQEPHFGDLRPVVLGSGADCLAPPPVPFSTDPSSAFYAQANDVLQLDLNLTKEQREIALYWADGAGSETPPGHWLKIANDLVRPLTLADAVQAYLPVMVSMFDAAIATWNTKYHYDLLRPETYVHRYIDAQWIPLLPTPQFPSYTSGHSGFSAAAATALTSVFGAGPFTDKTKVRGGFETRTYPNFMAAAIEAGLSRRYGGIHYQMDDEQGRAIGQCAANAVLTNVALHP
ncbi:MAG TPA: vanadium-dependent haloperoxidase [Polyangiaceae bacterium]|nr:vanadium-dependent haloperoxidase [Polyangiaceae bacterium]